MWPCDRQNIKLNKESNSSSNIFVNRSTFYGKLIHIRRGFRKMPRNSIKKDGGEKSQALKPKSRSFCLETNDNNNKMVVQDFSLFFGEHWQFRTSTLKSQEFSSQPKNMTNKISPELKRLITAAGCYKTNAKKIKESKITKYQTEASLKLKFKGKNAGSDGTKLTKTQNGTEGECFKHEQRNRSKTIPMKSLYEKFNKEVSRETITNLKKVLHQKKDQSLQELIGKRLKSNEKFILNRIKVSGQASLQQSKASQQKQVLILQTNQSKIDHLDRNIEIKTRVGSRHHKQQNEQKLKLKVRVDSQNLVGPWSKQGFLDQEDQQVQR